MKRTGAAVCKSLGLVAEVLSVPATDQPCACTRTFTCLALGAHKSDGLRIILALVRPFQAYDPRICFFLPPFVTSLAFCVYRRNGSHVRMEGLIARVLERRLSTRQINVFSRASHHHSTTALTEHHSPVITTQLSKDGLQCQGPVECS